MTDTTKGAETTAPKSEKELSFYIETIEALKKEIAEAKKEIAAKDFLINEQAEELARLEKKLATANVRPTVIIKKKEFSVNSGAHWEGVDYSAEELAEAPEVCEAIMAASPKSPIFSKED
jgi:chromosome segregation ATPase